MGPGDVAQRVLVVGGGVIGLSCAWRLAEAGHDVTVVAPTPGGDGASWVAAGMLAPVTEIQFGEAALTELLLEGAKGWKEFDRGAGSGLGPGHRVRPVGHAHRRPHDVRPRRPRPAPRLPAHAGLHGTSSVRFGMSHAGAGAQSDGVRRYRGAGRPPCGQSGPAGRAGDGMPHIGCHVCVGARDVGRCGGRRANRGSLRWPPARRGRDPHRRRRRDPAYRRPRGSGPPGDPAGEGSHPPPGSGRRCRRGPHSPAAQPHGAGARARAVDLSRASSRPVPRCRGDHGRARRRRDRAGRGGARALERRPRRRSGHRRAGAARGAGRPAPGHPDNTPVLGWTALPGVAVASGHFRNGILLAPFSAAAMVDLFAAPSRSQRAPTRAQTPTES